MTSGVGRSRANEQRAIRQEALREQLSAQGHVQHVIDCAHKIGELDSSDESSQFDLQKLKAKAEIHMKLVDKYLPGLKSVEVSGDGGGPVELSLAERMERLAALADIARARGGGGTADAGSAVDAPEGPAD